MAKKPPPDAFIWMKNTGQLWKLQFETWLAFYGLFAFVPALFLCFNGRWSTGIVILGVWLAGKGVEGFLQYYTIRCPSCKHNPARRNGRALNSKALQAKLSKMERCEGCGASGV